MAGIGGTLKTAGGGAVTFSRGRGDAKECVRIEADDIARWAKKCGMDVPKMIEKATVVVTKGLKSKFIATVRSRGGKNGVPSWKDYEDFTDALREIRGRQNNPMGGVLADKSRVVCYKGGDGYWHIGWPDRLADWARKFQDGEGPEFPWKDAGSRRKLHLRGIDDIPTEYTHNPRPIVGPMQEYADQYLRQWAKDKVAKDIARKMIQTGAVKVKGVA